MLIYVISFVVQKIGLSAGTSVLLLPGKTLLLKFVVYLLLLFHHLAAVYHTSFLVMSPNVLISVLLYSCMCLKTNLLLKNCSTLKQFEGLQIHIIIFRTRISEDGVGVLPCPSPFLAPVQKLLYKD